MKNKNFKLIILSALVFSYLALQNGVVARRLPRLKNTRLGEDISYLNPVKMQGGVEYPILIQIYNSDYSKGKTVIKGKGGAWIDFYRHPIVTGSDVNDGTARLVDVKTAEITYDGGSRYYLVEGFFTYCDRNGKGGYQIAHYNVVDGRDVLVDRYLAGCE